MEKLKRRGFITLDGEISVFNPDIRLLPLLKKLGFQMESEPPPEGFIPNFQKTRQIVVPNYRLDDLSDISTEELWKIHDNLISGNIKPSLNKDNANLLDLKVELAGREIEKCELCGRLCGVNRFKEIGFCGLKDEAYYSELYVHIAEERCITPALVVQLFGCGLRCIFCPSFENLDISGGKKLDLTLWKDVKKVYGFSRAKSIEFVGGNPDENLCSILWTLSLAPKSFHLPVVWNNHLYATEVVYRLLSGLVDLWVPDFKYWSNLCAERLSGIKNYREYATEGIKEMIKQNAKVIVRILILPGHIECCHQKTLEWVSLFREKIWISLMDQFYVPEGCVITDPLLNRGVSKAEVEKARELIKKYNLREVKDSHGKFWQEG